MISMWSALDTKVHKVHENSDVVYEVGRQDVQLGDGQEKCNHRQPS